MMKGLFMNRRMFLQQAGWAVASFSLMSSLNAAPDGKSKRPNIVLIMADDMGFSDIGCYGGEIETPHLDQLAAHGVRFTHFYNTARCCPTRASLMTGLHPHETGIGHMTNSPKNKEFDFGPEFPGYRGFLNRHCMTIAEVLKEAGYATLMTGKWHLGINDRSRWPLQRGFEKFYGLLPGASNFFYPEHPRGITLGNTPIDNPPSTTDRRFYTTDAFTDYAIRFIQEEKQGQDRPFFLYLAYTCPHWPLHAHQQEVNKYRGKYGMGWDQLRQQRLKRQIEMGLIDPKWKLSENGGRDWDTLSEQKKKEMDLRMAYYAAMIDRMDQNIGKLVQTLKQTGHYDNTLIMFLSDNGGCAEGGILGGSADPFNVEQWERTYGSGPSYGRVWANASNTPFRKYKHFTHEGGIATPFIAHWPNGISDPNRWFRESATLIDIMPTVLDLTGATYPERYNDHPLVPLTGVSLKPAFLGQSLRRSAPLFFEHENNAAMILGDWKLVGTRVSVPDGPDDAKWELYNLREDRTEMNNLAEKYPQIVRDMSEQWKKWAQKANVYPKPKT